MKGINPVIATIFLIFFIVGISLFYYTLITRRSIVNEVKVTAYLTVSDSTGKVYVIIKNVGTTKITHIKVMVEVDGTPSISSTYGVFENGSITTTSEMVTVDVDIEIKPNEWVSGGIITDNGVWSSGKRYLVVVVFTTTTTVSASATFTLEG